MSWCLKSVENANLGSIIQLKKGPNYLGRKACSDIRITSANVSRTHGYITLRDDKALISDLLSFNGIFIGNTKIMPNRELELKDGDLLGIGINPTLPYDDKYEAERCIFNVVCLPKTDNNQPEVGATGNGVNSAPCSPAQREQNKTPSSGVEISPASMTGSDLKVPSDDKVLEELNVKEGEGINSTESREDSKEAEDLYLIPAPTLVTDSEECSFENAESNERVGNFMSEKVKEGSPRENCVTDEKENDDEVVNSGSDGLQNNDEVYVIDDDAEIDENFLDDKPKEVDNPVVKCETGASNQDDYLNCDDNSFSALNFSQCDDDVIILDDDEIDENFHIPLIKKEYIETLDLTIEEEDDDVGEDYTGDKENWEVTGDHKDITSEFISQIGSQNIESSLSNLFGIDGQDANNGSGIDPLEGDLISSLLSQREEPQPVADSSPGLKRKTSLVDDNEQLHKKTRVSEDEVALTSEKSPSVKSDRKKKGKLKRSDSEENIFRAKPKGRHEKPSVKKTIKDIRRDRLKEIANKEKEAKAKSGKPAAKESALEQEEVLQGEDKLQNGDSSCAKITQKTRSALLIDAIAMPSPCKKRAKKPEKNSSKRTKGDTLAPASVKAPPAAAKAPPSPASTKAPPPSAAAKAVSSRASAKAPTLSNTNPPQKQLRFKDDDLVQVKLFTPEEKAMPVIPINQQDVIRQACKWNPKWIQECALLKGLPPLLENSLTFSESMLTPTVKESYADFKDYERTMYPLLIYELWDSIFRSSQHQRTVFVACVNDSIPLPHSEANPHLAMDSLIIQLLFGGGIAPRKGDFIVVKSQAGDQSRAVWTGFGFVTETMRQTKLQHTLDPTVQKLYRESKATFQGSKQVNCLAMKIIVRQRKVDSLCPGSLLTIEVLMNMNKDLRLFTSMAKLLNSPLEHVLLNPQRALIDEDILVDPEESSYQGMNEEQRRAIDYCKKMALSEGESLTVIHGPPGTGKSVTISRLVQEIVKVNLKKHPKKRRVRVLLCAPSNYAVDELVSRLMDERESLPSPDRFKLVRYGKIETISPKARLVSLNSFAHKQLDRIAIDKKFSHQMLTEMCEKEKHLTQQVDKHPGYSGRRAMQELMDTRRHIKDVRDFLEKKGDQRVQERLLSNIEKEILYHCDIVATTLSSATSFHIGEAFFQRDGRTIKPFNCCIVDEASQSIELQTLSPILLSVDKFILVGDHKQLSPVVTSNVAKECGLGMSLFERLLRCWKGKTDAPLFPLVRQFRMHPEIVKFPNKAFYSGALVSDETTKASPSPLAPYLVLNHSHKQTQSDERNEDEASIVIKLVKLIIQRSDCKDFRIGIITPYQAQKVYLQSLLENMRGKCDSRINVNTIDSAQGQEREVVIISLVKTSGVGFLNDPNRINVALTRAKHALFIVANFCSLKNCDIWRDLKSDAQKRHLLKSVSSSTLDTRLENMIFKHS